MKPSECVSFPITEELKPELSSCEQEQRRTCLTDPPQRTSRSPLGP